MLALANQVKAIVIVDNGSTDEELRLVHELVAGGHAELILNGRNLGLAAALNQGLTWGEKRGLQWVVTFDQDTTPGENLIQEAGLIFDAHRTKPIAVIGAGWVGTPRYGLGCADPGGIELACVITSGALHSVAIWRTLGGFRDDFFIDYVDTEYCLRARRDGYLVTRACRITMHHTIGAPSTRRMIFRSVTPSNHSTMRRYFITRNRIRVWRMYWRREAAYVGVDVKAFWKELVKLVLFESDRPAKLHAVARGVRDGIFKTPQAPLAKQATNNG
jgi:rhamnosyltransferase